MDVVLVRHPWLILAAFGRRTGYDDKRPQIALSSGPRGTIAEDACVDQNDLSEERVQECRAFAVSQILSA